MRARLPIRNALGVSQEGLSFLYLNIDSAGNVQQDFDTFEVTDLTGYVFKIKLNSFVPITEAYLADTNMNSNAAGSGVTQTFAIYSSVCVPDFNTYTGTYKVATSTPQIDTDGKVFFYLAFDGVGEGETVNAYVKVVTSSLLKLMVNA